MPHEFYPKDGDECDVCGIRSFAHSHPDGKPKDFFKIDESTLLKVAREASCLQRIQMIVWEYMDTPKHKRNGVDMAQAIFEDVKKTLET